jgi:hypothetical protein
VPNAKRAVQGLVAQHRFQVAEFPRSTANFERGAGRIANGDTRRIVAAILKPPQPLDDDRDHLLGTYITDYAAHGTILSDSDGGGYGE